MFKIEKIDHIIELVDRNILNKNIYEYVMGRINYFSKGKKFYTTDNFLVVEYKKESFSISFEPNENNVEKIKICENCCEGRCTKSTEISFNNDIISVKENEISRYVSQSNLPVGYAKESKESIYLNNNIAYENELKFYINDNPLENDSESDLSEIYVLNDGCAILYNTIINEDNNNKSQKFYSISYDFDEPTYNNRINKTKNCFVYGFSNITESEFMKLKQNIILNKEKTLKKIIN